MDSGDAHRIYLQLKRIADAAERISPPPPKPKKESAEIPHFSERRGVVY